MVEQLDAFGGGGKKMKGGYRGDPGAGPVGETCRSCKYSYYMRRRNPRRYWKCGLVKHTAGDGTDIRLKAPACQFWESEIEDIPEGDIRAELGAGTDDQSVTGFGGATDGPVRAEVSRG